MNDGEKRRIEEAGGRVMIQRINGSLAVSRALGDFEYKQRTDRGENMRPFLVIEHFDQLCKSK